MTTSLKFLEDTEEFESNAKVVSVDTSVSQPGSVIILDETIFYPQGGGQPTDVGTIAKDGAVFDVTKASFGEGIVYHQGVIRSGKFESGDEVNLVIDGSRRMRHAKLHTGGHLVMTAVDRLLHLPAVKGYHFPDGPYVEFLGTVDPNEREQLITKLQDELDNLVSENSDVTSEFISITDLRDQGVYIPAEIPSGKPTRVVITSGYKSPCGGTHVKKLGELHGLKIKGIKNKSGKTRVSYYIEGI